MQLEADVVRTARSAPAELDSFLGIPEPRAGVLHLVQQDAVMEPGNLSSNLLDNWFVWPSVGEPSHVE
jgi:hypothetical protein